MKISALNLKIGDGVEVWPISYVAMDSGDKKYQAIIQNIWVGSPSGVKNLSLFDGKRLHTVIPDLHGWGIRKLSDVETAVLLVHQS
jgi:hypothetical protein